MKFSVCYPIFSTKKKTEFLLNMNKVAIEEFKEPILNRDFSWRGGSTSSYDAYTKHIFSKGQLGYNAKTSPVHHELCQLLKKWPHHFDDSLFLEMTRFLVLVSKNFLEPRPSRAITRIISFHHLMRRDHQRNLHYSPKNRLFSTRCHPLKLQYPFGFKRVLGLIVAFYLSDKREFFEESHVLQAAQKLLGQVEAVPGSFYFCQNAEDSIRTLYLELEKKDGSPFSQKEISLLKNELNDELGKHIEKLVPNVFMPRNEEEIMKNILILSQELKSSTDLPQVMISFDKQSNTDLVFTILLVSIQEEEKQSLQQIFQQLMTPIECIVDHKHEVGFVDKNIPKKALVFRLCIPKDSSLLRADSSINIYLAREKVVSLLEEAIGPFRDYNGGLILKQREQFRQFKEGFKDVSDKHPELLENFFFSLHPVEMQAILPLSSLMALFQFFLEAARMIFKKREEYYLKIHEDREDIFAVIRAQGYSLIPYLEAAFKKFKVSEKHLINTSVEMDDTICHGYIYTAKCQEVKKQYLDALQEAIHRWNESLSNAQILRLSCASLPKTLDPRQGGDELSSNVFKMLYDGLTRIGRAEKSTLAIAQSVKISDDLKHFEFHLRESYWSNGLPLTAQDFEYTWKKILSPDFFTPFAYFFYPIKNAKAAKEGSCPLDKVGIRALDNKILSVDLEYPLPEFLELTAHAIYSPVSHLIDRIHPNWLTEAGTNYTSNGPFLLKNKSSHGYELVKNPYYWDKENVKIDQILISQDNPYIAAERYKKGEIDWIGQSLGHLGFFPPELSDERETFQSLATCWCVFNVACFPFDHVKIRQAFAYTIDQCKLVQFFPFESLPASTPLPLPHTYNTKLHESWGNPQKAKKLFEEALKELDLARKNFPTLTIIYNKIYFREKLALLVKQQLEDVLEITCEIEGHEFSSLFSRMTAGNFQLGIMSWKAWVDDPMYTLNAFKHATNQVNFSKWENSTYQKLVDTAQIEADLAKRRLFQEEAEKILIDQRPVIPLLHENQQSAQKSYLKGVLHSSMGNIDFKYAYLTRREICQK